MKRLVGLLLALLTACGGSSVAVKVAPQADVAAYAAEQKACVDVAHTRAEADQCIAEVKAQYCGDGGSLHAAGGC